MAYQSTKALSVAFIADSPVIVVGWSELIREAPLFDLLGSFSHKEAYSNSKILSSDGVIIDASVNQLSCLRTIRQLRKQNEDIPIVVVMARIPNSRFVDAQDMRRAGANAVLRISRMQEGELIDAVGFALRE